GLVSNEVNDRIGSLDEYPAHGTVWGNIRPARIDCYRKFAQAGAGISKLTLVPPVHQPPRSRRVGPHHAKIDVAVAAEDVVVVERDGEVERTDDPCLSPPFHHFA